MAQTNAQRQAAFKQRRDEQLSALRRENEALKRKAALWEEVWGQYNTFDIQLLLNTIKEVRDNGGKPIATAFVEGVVKVEERIAGRKAVEDDSRPAVGRVFWAWAFPEGGESAEIIKCTVTNGKQAHVRRLNWAIGGKPYSQAMKHRVGGYWNVPAFSHLVGLFDSEEEARKELADAERGASEMLRRIFAEKRNPEIERLSDHELRLVRSRNHPDKNHDADTVLYQQAVEELARRRGR